MSASFLTVGNESVNADSVDYAAWLADKDNPQSGNLQVTLAGSKDCLFPFETPGVVELAAAVGLGEPAKEWAKVNDAKAKAAEKALKDAEKEAEPKVETEPKPHAHKTRG